MSKQHKPYNPNTTYGRRKLREQARQEYDNITLKEQPATRLGVRIVFIIVFFLSGIGGVIKYLTN